jgi:hypothetical protein
MRRLTMLATMFLLTSVFAPRALAQDKDDDTAAITARVHGTFQDKAAGLGVLSGDMAVVRFEVRNGTVTAIGRIVGALADGSGNVLGQVDEELAMPVGSIGSTCNQLRMELAATDAEILRTAVHFDAEVAGFDSRDGTTPRALGVLCAAADVLRGKPAPDAIVQALNAVATAVKSAR